jgi:AhpD family alkylhydroperoxidase
MRRLLALQEYVNDSGLEKPLLELVKLRASQINGCAYCIDMHTKDAAAQGETQQRMHGLMAWRECPYYTERERAALEWTEAVTLLTQGHVPDEVYERVSAQFDDKELADLTLAAATINTWNRLAVAARTTPGTYKPAEPAAAHA